MGSKYSSVSVSGYNSSPPSDDGSTTEANKVKWSTHKTKLGDPLKTAIEGVNTALVTAFDLSARAISASDSAVATDHDRVIQVTSPSVVVTLSDAATMAAGYTVTVANQSTGSATVALATATDMIDTVTNTTSTIPAKGWRTYRVNAAANGYLTVGLGPGGQYAFPATQNASSDANTLDDYEEGTWTPAITFATAGNLSVAYSTQNGRYVKVGKKVTIWGNIVTSTFTHTTASGSLRISGLPFTVVNVSGHEPHGACIWQGITKSGYSSITVQGVINDTLALLAASGSGQALANIAAADMPSGGSVILRFCLNYEASA